jgi:diguanylate cyclase (GGDEF)-like protein/PAS domain S-box-containing protein
LGFGDGLGDALVAAAHDAVICADGRGEIIGWNAAAERLFGHAARDVIGRSLDLIVPEEMRGEHAAGMRRLLEGGEPRLVGRSMEVPAQAADGRQFPVEMRLSMWQGEDGPIFGAVLRDASERRATQDRLHSLAHFDQLTMLPNRSLFLDRMRLALGAGEDERPAAVLLVDIGQLADLNDAEGHAAGDALLRVIAIELKRVVNADAEDGENAPTVARVGGGQFAILLPGLGDLIAVSDIARRVTDRVDDVSRNTQSQVPLSISVGVALAPSHGSQAGKLLANADFALRRAKADGGARCQIFQPQFRDAALARRELDFELRRAWEAKEFEVFYQPQVDLRDRSIVGAEALLRWRHPQRGVQAPHCFIHVLQDSAIAADIGSWVLATACQQAAQWRRVTGRSFRIGVNVFEAQLADADLAGEVRDAIAASRLPPEDLEIEITENIMTASDDASVARVQRLRDLGVGIAFDDYGTGYASLSLLKRYPLTRLKIDRSFVRDLSDDQNDAAIVELVLTLGARLGLGVVAEGVETEAQAERLASLGCREAQGYLFGRPMPAQDFARLIGAVPMLASEARQA